MMWDANYAGPWYGYVTYAKAPMMLSMLGGIVGDSAVQRAMSAYAMTWRFRHPIALGLHVRDEPRASTATWGGSGTTGCSPPSRWTGRSIQCGHEGQAHHRGHRARERRNAVAGHPQGGVRGRGPGPQADDRTPSSTATAPRDLAGGRLVRWAPDLRGGARLRRAARSSGSPSIRRRRFPDRNPRTTCGRASATAGGGGAAGQNN